MRPMRLPRLPRAARGGPDAVFGEAVRQFGILHMSWKPLDFRPEPIRRGSCDPGHWIGA
jgi:hypothetical protein